MIKARVAAAEKVSRWFIPVRRSITPRIVLGICILVSSSCSFKYCANVLDSEARYKIEVLREIFCPFTMVRTRRRYIFTQTREYTPGGTLQLGQVIAHPFEPGHSLLPRGPIPIPSSLIQEETSQESVTATYSHDPVVMFSLWARFTSLPLNSSTGAIFKSSNELSWNFERLSSKVFAPSLDYVTSAMHHGDVLNYIKGKLFKSRVYMITGVRIAHGAKMVKRKSHSIHTHVGGSVDSDAMTAPASAGWKAGLTPSSSSGESFEKASDFVYAYKLNEINYRGRLSHKPFKKGETSGLGSPVYEENGSEIPEWMVEDFDVEGLDDEDFDGGEFEFDTQELPKAEHHEYEYECILPSGIIS